MLDIALFFCAWLIFGTLVHTIIHAAFNLGMDDQTSSEVVLGAVFWPVVLCAPLAAAIYVSITVLRRRIVERFEKKSA